MRVDIGSGTPYYIRTTARENYLAALSHCRAACSTFSLPSQLMALQRLCCACCIVPQDCPIIVDGDRMYMVQHSANHGMFALPI